MRRSCFAYRIFSIGYRQIKYILPKKYWERVVIVENNDPMVTYEGCLVRKQVAEKLDQVKQILPEGYFLKIIEGYRSLEKQQQAWDRKWNQVVLENPNWSKNQIDTEVRLVVARPVGVTNHICGGAVDVCLINAQGDMFDFGTEYAPADEEGRKKCPMFSNLLTSEQKKNRKILRKAMESAGFVWYPGEWWHYCYGDRMWAVYTNRNKCMYGPIEEDGTPRFKTEKYPEIPHIKFLTREEINRVPIQENGEGLVEIPITSKSLHRTGDGAKWLVPKLRKMVLEKYLQASESLPDGYKLMIMSAYIPISLQQQVWNSKYEKIKKQNPHITDPKELELLTRKFAAYPVKGAPHNTGASVDPIIIGPDNQPLDMGSEFGGVGKSMHTRFADITPEQKYNRQMLFWTMVRAGFINTNPFEWWHYSHGDRAWAAYAGESTAIYDGIED